MTIRAGRFLFTTMDGGGNVAPLMSVVSRLVERGHSVRVMSDESSRTEVRAAGARFVPWVRAPNRAVRSRESDPPDWAGPPDAGIRMVAEHLMGGFALPYAQDTSEELEREAADLVVTWDMLTGVMLACEARGQPFALLTTCISNLPLPGVPPLGSAVAPPGNDRERARYAEIEARFASIFDSGLPALNTARAAFGLRPLEHLVDQAQPAAMRFLGTARAFDFPSDDLPDTVRYVGPLIRDPLWAEPWSSPWPASDPRPLALVGFSTSFQNHADCLQRVIDAGARLPARVLVTLGGSIRRDELRAASNTAIADAAPHHMVMRDASLVVTHGGHGTVMTALMHRLPTLVLPHGRDQGDNAVRLTERGAGLALPNTASTDEIHAALSRLLADPAFREGARRLGDAVAAEAERSTLLADLERLASGIPAPEKGKSVSAQPVRSLLERSGRAHPEQR